MYSDYFSKKVAKDKSFFDRKEETQRLIIDITSSNNTWLAGERRFGKTSIATYACNQIHKSKKMYGITEFAWDICDISSCATLDSAQRKILHSISEATSQIINNKKNIAELAKSIFNKFTPELAIGGRDLAKLTMKLKIPSGIESPIDLAIKSLDELATKCKAKACIIIDEFQTLQEIDKNKGEKIEWDIRGGLQHAENVCMIFAGSKRRMMTEAFTDQSRALFGMCSSMSIDELPADDCIKHLKKAAKESGFTFDDGALERIYEISKGHPRDFNQLALSSFQIATFDETQVKHITEEIVGKAWNSYVTELTVGEVKSIIREKQAASKKTEIALLIAIAHIKPTKVTTAEFTSFVGFSATSINHALTNLDQQGLIRKRGPRWELCEPSYESALIQISDDQIDKDALFKVLKSEEK
ncbi:hypothetical protein CTH30272_03068 [Allocatenococcus thiocycli]|nr:hypothetical protein CTH30272_03068 [Catenococcus thiocycli]